MSNWLANVLWMLAGAAVAAAYCILMQRRHVPNLTFEAPAGIDRLGVIAGLTRAAVQLGNTAQVLQNGAFFDALERDIRAARSTVHIETFVWTRGELETRFANLLCAKVREGAKVRVVIDAMGGIRASHVVSDSCGLALSSVGMLYTVAIACARREVLIQNPYFAPDDTVVELFAAVVRRGVAVRLMVPGENTDSPFVRRAGWLVYQVHDQL